MKQSLFSLALLLPALAFSQKKLEVTIHGEVKNMPDPYVKVYMFFTDDGDKKLDSADIINGKYSLKTTISAPLQATIAAIQPRTGKPVMVSEKTRVQVFLSEGTITVYSENEFNNVKVTGSAAHDAYQQLNASATPYREKIRSLMMDAQTAKKEGRTDDATAIDTEMRKLNEEMREKVYGDYVRKSPNSPVAMVALQAYGSGGNLDKAIAMFKTLPVEIQESSSGKQYYARAMGQKNVSVGSMAPDFIQNDTLGNPIRLSSFRGQYVLVDFWASWCGPCRKENPNVVKAYQQFKDKGFAILGVSLDKASDKAKWIKAIHDDNLTWTHVSDLKYWGNEAALKYGVTGIPANFLIDKNGKIVARDLRGDALIKKLESLLQ